MGRRQSKSYASFGLWNECDAISRRQKPLTTEVTEDTGNPSSLTGQTGLFEFVAFFPGDLDRLVGGLPSQGEAETGHGGVGGVVHSRVVFVAGLVVVILGVVGILREAPGFVVEFELHACVDGEGGDANARETEVVGAIEVSGFWACVGTDGETELGGQ